MKILIILLLLLVPANAQTAYQEWLRYPDKYTDQRVDLRGKIIQSVEENNGLFHYFILRVNITQTDRGWSDTIYVEYAPPPSDPRLIEGDIVNIRGRFVGIKSYTAIFGQTIQIPFIFACELSAPSYYAPKPSQNCN